ncbi:MAG: diguanylate cyclase [Bacilli bacterium]|nr:diguanylate cyclase [Bacilli bacterium]
MNRREYEEYTCRNYERSEVLVAIGAFAIAIFEVVFAILNIVEKSRTTFDNAYLISYIVLFVATVVVIIFCTCFKKHKYFKAILPWFIHIYDTLISIWAFTISLLDIMNKASTFIEYPIVFITVMFSLPFFLRIHFALNTTITSIGMIILGVYANVTKGKYLVGYTGNLIVSLVMIILVSILGYRVSKKNFLLERTLLESSTKDGLTKLFNRGALDDRLEEVSKGRDLFNIVMLDCDNFKKINDEHGHRIGDEALVKIAELIQREFGKDCFRYGGDEFIIITTFTTGTIRDSFKQINAELKEHFGEVHVSVTAGIYQIENGSSSGHIIKCVDSALYEAKNTQKGTVAVYKQ